MNTKLNAEKMPKLGFGLMRLPETEGAVDVEAVKKIDRRMEAN